MIPEKLSSDELLEEASCIIGKLLADGWELKHLSCDRDYFGEEIEVKITMGK